MKTLTYVCSLFLCLTMAFSAQAQFSKGTTSSSLSLVKTTQIQGEIRIKKSYIKGRFNEAKMVNYIKGSIQVYNTKLGAQNQGLMPANYYGSPIPTKVFVTTAHNKAFYVFKYRAMGAYGAFPLWKPLMLKFKNNNVPHGINLIVVAHPLIATLTPNDKIFGDYNFNGQLPQIPR